MQNGTAFAAIREILCGLSPCLDRPVAILPEHRLREDLKLDSLDMVALQLTIEEHFHIRFNPIEMDLTEAFESVGSLAHFLEQYMEQFGMES